MQVSLWYCATKLILFSFNIFSIIYSPNDFFKQPQDETLYLNKFLAFTSHKFPQSHRHNQVLSFLFSKSFNGINLPKRQLVKSYPPAFPNSLAFSFCKQPHDFVPFDKESPDISQILPHSHLHFQIIFLLRVLFSVFSKTVNFPNFLPVKSLKFLVAFSRL